VRDYLDVGSWQLVGKFTEVESGKHAARPELPKSIELAASGSSSLDDDILVTVEHTIRRRAWA
jgi:hypothetical protein